MIEERYTHAAEYLLSPSFFRNNENLFILAARNVVYCVCLEKWMWMCHDDYGNRHNKALDLLNVVWYLRDSAMRRSP